MSNGKQQGVGIAITLVSLGAAFVLAISGYAFWVFGILTVLWLLSVLVLESRRPKAQHQADILEQDLRAALEENERLSRENERLRRGKGESAGTQEQSQQRQRRRGAFDDIFEAFFSGFAGGSRSRASSAGIPDDLAELLRSLGIDIDFGSTHGGFGGFGGFPGAGEKPKRDYYDVLGVERTASDDDIKRAYRKRAMQCHPDRFPGDKTKEAEFKELGEAHDCLKDDDKRAFYDRFGVAPK